MPLEVRDGPNAAVDRVPHPSLGFIGKGVYSVFSLVGEELVEELGYVACTEDFVDVCELLWLFGWEVGRENAAWHAFSTKELAGCAGAVVGGGGGG